VSTSRIAEHEQTVQSAWDSLWKTEVPDLQKTYGLKSSVPINQINDARLVLGNEKSSAEEKAESKAFLESLPKTDHAAFEKVRKAVYARYDFSTGVPVPKFKKWQTALIENDLLEDFPANAPVPPTEEQRAEMARRQAAANEAPPVLPGAGLGGHDPKMDAPKTRDEEYAELKTLAAEYADASKSLTTRDVFFASERFQRMNVLRQKFGMSPYVPQKRPTG
jgi:hypothetical protein